MQEYDTTHFMWGLSLPIHLFVFAIIVLTDIVLISGCGLCYRMTPHKC